VGGRRLLDDGGELSSPVETAVGWRSVGQDVSYYETTNQVRNPALRFADYGTLTYLGASWNEFGSPRNDREGAWQHTFMLSSLAGGFKATAVTNQRDSGDQDDGCNDTTSRYTDWAPAYNAGEVRSLGRGKEEEYGDPLDVFSSSEEAGREHYGNLQPTIPWERPWKNGPNRGAWRKRAIATKSTLRIEPDSDDLAVSLRRDPDNLNFFDARKLLKRFGHEGDQSDDSNGEVGVTDVCSALAGEYDCVGGDVVGASLPANPNYAAVKRSTVEDIDGSLSTSRELTQQLKLLPALGVAGNLVSVLDGAAGGNFGEFPAWNKVKYLTGGVGHATTLISVVDALEKLTTSVELSADDVVDYNRGVELSFPDFGRRRDLTDEPRPMTGFNAVFDVFVPPKEDGDETLYEQVEIEAETPYKFLNVNTPSAPGDYPKRESSSLSWYVTIPLRPPYEELGEDESPHTARLVKSKTNLPNDGGVANGQFAGTGDNEGAVPAVDVIDPTTGSRTVFDGSSSLLTDAPIGSYRWTVHESDADGGRGTRILGPSDDQYDEATFADGQVLAYDFSADGPGEYVVTLELEEQVDGTETPSTSSISRTVTVNEDDSPSTSIERSDAPDSTTVTLGESATFEATDTADVASYSWELPSDASAAASASGTDLQPGTPGTIEYEPSSPGIKPITLSVADDDGNVATTGYTLKVDNEPPDPAFDAEPSLETVSVGQQVTFDAGETTDPTNDEISYEWTFRGPVDAVQDPETWTETGEVVTTSFGGEDAADATDAGTQDQTSSSGPGRELQFDAFLTATDEWGASQSTDVRFTVDLNDGPTVDSVDASPTDPVTGEDVTFTATASDADDTVESYDWTLTDAEGTQVATGTGASTTESFADPGTYTAAVTVTDDDGATAEGSTDVSVATATEPPVVESFDHTPTDPVAGTTVSFEVTANDPDGGEITTYEFAFGDGTSTTTSDGSVDHTYDAAGTYDATVTVVDDDDEATTATDTVTVAQPTEQPVIDSIGASPSTPTAGETVTFDVTASDPDGGEITTFEFAFGDGSSTTESEGTATHVYDGAGEYTAEVVVTDDEGQTASATTTVSVEQSTDVPIIGGIDVDPSDPVAGEAVTLAADATDPDGGSIVEHQWTFGDGESATTGGETVTHVYESAGTYDISLSVTDDEGQTASATASVSVAAPDEPPVIDAFTASPSTPTAGETVTFDVPASDPDGGDVVEYQFAFDDGTTTTESERTATHVYDGAGEYTAEAVVTDDEDQTASATTTVSVDPAPAAPQITDLSITPSEPSTGEQVTVDVTASDPDGGEIVEYAVEFGDGESTVGQESSVTHSYGESGEYTVAVTVTDDEGQTASSSRTITVADAAQPPVVESFDHSPTDPAPGEYVDFTADATDPDGGVLTQYDFAFGDGGTTFSSLPSANHAYDDPGEYTAEVTVTDADGLTATGQTTVSVTAPIEPVIDVSPTEPGVGETVTVDATATTAPASATYQWSIDGTAYSGPTVSTSFDESGQVDVGLTVQTASRSVTETTTLTVSAQNEGPTASFTVPSLITSGSDLALDGGDSTDPDGEITRYRWAIDDVGSRRGESVTTSFQTGGTKEITLTVTDDDGATDSRTESVYVLNWGSPFGW
jgi:PKD repeat protein